MSRTRRQHTWFASTVCLLATGCMATGAAAQGGGAVPSSSVAWRAEAAGATAAPGPATVEIPAVRPGSPAAASSAAIIPVIGRIVADAGQTLFEGSGDPGTLVELADGALPVGVAPVDNTGRWRLVVDRSFSAGGHRFSIASRDLVRARRTAGADVQVEFPKTISGAAVVLHRAAVRLEEAPAAESRLSPPPATDNPGEKFGEAVSSPQWRRIAQAQPPKSSPQSTATDGSSWTAGWLDRASRDYQELIVKRLSDAPPQPAKAAAREAVGSQPQTSPVRTVTPDAPARMAPAPAPAPPRATPPQGEQLSYVDQLQDWLSRSGKDYYGRIVKKLAVQDTGAGAPPGQTPPVDARAEEEALRKADAERRLAEQKAAEARRLAEQQQAEARRAAELKTAEAVRPVPPPVVDRATQEAAARAEEERRTAEARRLEEERRIAEARRLDEERAREARLEAERRQAEAKRIEEEKRKAAEAASKSDEAQRALEEARREAQRKAQEQVEKQQAEERRRQQEQQAARQAEQQRQAELQKQAELQRQAEQQRQAELQRRAELERQRQQPARVQETITTAPVGPEWRRLGYRSEEDYRRALAEAARAPKDQVASSERVSRPVTERVIQAPVRTTRGLPHGYASDDEYRRALAEASRAPKETDRARTASLSREDAERRARSMLQDEARRVAQLKSEKERRADERRRAEELRIAARAPKVIEEGSATRAPRPGPDERSSQGGAVLTPSSRRTSEDRPAAVCKSAGRRVALPGTYVVRKGDSLWSIAERFYGDGEMHLNIQRANKGRLADPDVIEPCQKLRLPRGAR